MKLNEAFPSNFLKCADLEGSELPLVIASATIEEIGTDRKLVLRFQGEEKALVCNKTNAMTIAHKYGEETDDWIGREVILTPATAMFNNRVVDAIRVRLPAPPRTTSRVQTSPRAMAAQPMPGDPPPWEPEGR
jgi:hypothetical protein